MKIQLPLILVLWTIVLSVSFIWNVQTSKSDQEILILQSAKTLFEQMVITRRWNSSNNGVYVKITDTVKPNPYLKDPERDLDCGGVRLTKINPAFMTRQISEFKQ